MVNVQGDETEIEPGSVERLVELLAADTACPVATLACPFSKVPGADPADPAAVKVVVDRRGRALYFSRSLIPHCRVDAEPVAGAVEPLLHLGIYAYRRDFLLELASCSPAPLERAERLEQLRVLEQGHDMAVAIVDRAAVGIDTPQDYAVFVRRFREKDRSVTEPKPSSASHAR